MRVKFIKANKYNKPGDIAEVSPNVAFGLIDAGIAIITKDLTSDDYKVVKTETSRSKDNGKST